MAPFKPRTADVVHLSTSPRHNSIYIEVCQRRGLKAISDDLPPGTTDDDFDVWRYGPNIWKKTDVAFHHGYGQHVPIQRNEIDLEWVGPKSFLHQVDDLTNLVMALNKRLPNVPFVPWNMFDNDIFQTLIEMEPTGWFLWVWTLDQSHGMVKTDTTGIHFQNETDAIAFVGLTS